MPKAIWADAKGRLLLALAVLSMFVGAAFWLCGPRAVGSIREVGVGLGVNVAGLAAYFWVRHVFRMQQQAFQFFDQLSRVDTATLCRAATAEPLALSPANPWSALARPVYRERDNHGGAVATSRTTAGGD